MTRACAIAFLLVLFVPSCSDRVGEPPGAAAGNGPTAGAAGSVGLSGAGGGGSAGASGGAGVSGSASGSAATGGSGNGAGGASGSGGATGGATAGTGGSGGAPLPPVKPVQVGERWSLTLGEVTLEIDPAIGGRITAFKLGTENLLTGPEVNETYWGSTLWTSPESQWSHPPPEPIDTAAYTVEAGETSVTMKGSVYEPLGVSVTKIFSADPARGSFVIEYRLTNHEQTPIEMAPWEVTRVFPRGLTFYPTGTSKRLWQGATMPTTDSGGITWFPYDMVAVTVDSKLYADGAEGWLAHVAAGLVFIKKFPDVPPEKIAPDEGDIELYTNAAHSYIELENQAAFGPIAPGASVSWKVEWFLLRLPSELQATAGNVALAQFVRDTID